MPLGTDHLTIATSAEFIPEVWSGKVIYAAESRLVAMPLVTEYSGFSGGDEGFGDVLHVPSISDFVANDKTANTEVTLQDPGDTDDSLTINKHKETSYMIEDRLRKVALGTYLDFYSKKAGYAIAKAIDTDILAEYANAATIVGDASTAITRENIVRAIFNLNDADVPMEDRAFVIAADGFSDILNIDEFTLYTNTGETPAPIVTGARGEVLGLPIFMSTNVPVAAGTPNAVHNLVLHKEAIGYAMPQPPRPQSDYMLEFLGWLYVVDAIYGVKTFRADFMVDFVSLEIV